MKILNSKFYDRDAVQVAKDLLGKVIYRRHKQHWLTAQIIETEAYYLDEKGSHSSLGYTHNRRALFMPAGTVYMYYARGGDSLNISVHGEGNAVLIKSAIVYNADHTIIELMHHLNPSKNVVIARKLERLCSGQTLLCKSLALKVPEWNAQQFDPSIFYIADVDYCPEKIIQTKRLGIPTGRDEDLLYRFIDLAHIKSCTKNPLTKRIAQECLILRKSKCENRYRRRR